MTVGVTPLAGASAALGAALAELRDRMPRLEITIETRNRRRIAIAAAKGELALGLTDGLTALHDPLPEQAPVTAVGISEDNVAVVLPAGHPLSAHSGLRLADLADARWIEADNVAPPLEEIRRHAGADGFKPAFCYTGTDTLSLIRLAVAGHGLTLLPESAVRGSEITSVRVALPRLSHRVELLHAALPKKSPAAALAEFLSRRQTHRSPP